MTSSRSFSAVFVLMLFGARAHAAGPLPRRLTSRISDSQTFILQGSTRPAVAHGIAKEQGEAPGSQALPRLYLHFSMTAAQRNDLNQLLTALEDPQSPEYHRFLTPEEYGARFGLNTADLAEITLWLENHGFSKVEVSHSRTFVSFSGTVALAESAFHVPMHNYILNGEAQVANTHDLALPKALEGIVESVGGLNNFRLKPQLRVRPQFTSSFSGNTFLAPDDWETIYDVKPLYAQGLNGTGVKIAVVGQSDVQLSDLAAFRVAAGLPASNPTVILAGADPGIVSGDELESDLDLEWSTAVAPDASILFVTASAVSGKGVLDAITYAIDNNIAPILSISYGACEADWAASELNSQNALFAEANAQGITVVAASGDSGAAACDEATPAVDGLAVDFPASSPYVTAVGGTRLSVGGIGPYWGSSNNGNNGSALSYIPEVVWNDGLQSGSAGGGGVSALISKPFWQTGAAVPADGYRDVPDLAVAADPDLNGYLICGHGFCTNGGFRDANSDLDVVGGTSCGAPTLAAVVALLVQKTGRPLGNLNPKLYALAAAVPNAFHDITSGNNDVACVSGRSNCPASGEFGYSAGVGYDLTTGWGSLDVFNFVTAAATNQPPSAVSITPSAGSGTTQTFTAVFSDPNGASGVEAAYVLFNKSVAAAHACYLEYYPSSNLLYLKNDAGSAFVPPTTGVPAGSSATLTNSLCSLSAAGVSYKVNGATATLTVPLTFFTTPPLNSYLYAAEKNGTNSGWVQKGAWGGGSVPTIVSVSPSSGSGAAQTFTATFNDLNGASAVSSAFLLLNNSLKASSGCYVEYYPRSNLLFLKNDAGSGFAAPSKGALLGSATVLANSQCQLSAAASSYSISATTATLSVSLSFTETSSINIYLYASDKNASDTGWIKAGAWNP